jgi:hypothetical protein
MDMFIIKQTAAGRHQIHTSNPNDYNMLPQNIRTAILWRSYPTAQEAFAAACDFWFAICDRR